MIIKGEEEKEELWFRTLCAKKQKGAIWFLFRFFPLFFFKNHDAQPSLLFG